MRGAKTLPPGLACETVAPTPFPCPGATVRMLRLAAASLVLALTLALACDTGVAGPARVRIGHFIPDAPAIDVCLKPNGTSAFSGKFVQQGGLSFGSVSARSTLDAGTYSLRIVSAGAADCTASLNGLGDISPVNVDGDTAVTVGLVGLVSGSGNTGVAEDTFVDDTAAPASPGVKLRFLHVSPELGQVDVGTIAGSSFSPLNPAVSLSYTGSSPYVGYANPLTDTLALVDTGTANLRLQGGFSVGAGSVTSVYIVGRPNQTSGDPRLSFLVCSDTTAACVRSP